MLRREKRQQRRILVSVEAEIKIASPMGQVSNPAPLRATVTNLSTTGMSMRLSEVHPIGTMMRVLLSLPLKQVLFFGSIRRVYPATAYHPSQYGHGVQIVAATEDVIEDIYEYMMNVTGRSASIEPTKVVEAFPAVVNSGLSLTKSDQPSSVPPATSPEQ